MPDCFDPGLALFAGLKAILNRSATTLGTSERTVTAPFRRRANSRLLFSAKYGEFRRSIFCVNGRTLIFRSP